MPYDFFIASKVFFLLLTSDRPVKAIEMPQNDSVNTSIYKSPSHSFRQSIYYSQKEWRYLGNSRKDI